MQKLIIKQKYLSLHEKFKILDENQQVAFQAQNQIIRVFNNMTLFDASGNMPLFTLRAKLTFIFAKYRVLAGDYESQKELGLIKEGFGLIFRKGKVNVEGLPQIAIVSGPIHLKAYLLDENGKKDKSQLVIKSTKKLLKICDTYELEYDETKIPSTLAAIVGLWYDMTNHNEQH